MSEIWQPATGAEDAETLVLKVVRDRRALPFLEIAARTGMRISALAEVVRSLASKNMVVLYGPDNPSEMVVGAK